MPTPAPRQPRDLIVKFALKRKFEVVMVAGQAVAKPAFAIVRLIVVPSGMDAADDYLVEHAVPGELVICSDVPLADRLVKKGVAALDPRGREFDERNMGDRLAARNLVYRVARAGPGGGEGRRLMASARSRRLPMRWTGSSPGCPNPEATRLAGCTRRVGAALCRERAAKRPQDFSFAA
ncbi:hypothetical protein PPS11_13561 [Pseudomonas putida S11]|nr:hypothetical protein PPS11_13561 [Pseudomonas putida S11]